MRLYKRVLSLMLSLLLLLTGVPMAWAGAEENLTPVIRLAGFGTELYVNEDTPEEYGALTRAQRSMGTALEEALRESLKNPLQLLCSPNPLADILADYMGKLVGVLACDENGDSIYPVTRNNSGYSFWHNGRWTYEFNFDWRLDPMDTARALDEFIQQVKEDTGSTRVNLNAISFGGSICLAYLEQFGTGDLESLFLFQSAHGGLIFVEELAQKQFKVSGKGLAAFLAQMLPENAALIQALDCLGLFCAAQPGVNLLLRCIRERFYEQAIVPLLVQMPAVWAFIADDAAYKNAKALLLSDAKYAALTQRIDAYHSRVALRRDEILQAAAEEIKVALVCGYGLAPIPLGGNALYQSDFMVSTARASGGAVCAGYGETLPKDYPQTGYLSPDHVIDASTCVLRDQTWFVKDYEHQYEFGGAGIYHWFLSCETQPTVWDNAVFPQFR